MGNGHKRGRAGRTGSMRWRTSTWNSKNPKTTQSIRASPGPAARKMYKVIAKANLYISGRAAMEARRLSKCEYGTERQQNLLKMPLALCGTGHSKREGEGVWLWIGLRVRIWLRVFGFWAGSCSGLWLCLCFCFRHGNNYISQIYVRALWSRVLHAISVCPLFGLWSLHYRRVPWTLPSAPCPLPCRAVLLFRGLRQLAACWLSLMCAV